MSPLSGCGLTGLLVATLAIPMALRKVPPNRFYGLRVTATLADRSVWYEANAKSGRDMIIVGTSISILAVILSRLDLPEKSSALICATFSTAAVIGAALRGWRFAEKLRRERQALRH